MYNKKTSILRNTVRDVNKMRERQIDIFRYLYRGLLGAIIGVGAVLPGISGGVLCVAFGIYKPVMELLGDPLRMFRTHIPKLLPVLIGAGVGFLGVSNVLAFFLEAYPGPSVCLFIGLILGMLPSLFREAGSQGRPKGSWIALVIAFATVVMLLAALNLLSVHIIPNIWWYVFCGFCLALSVILPGMSFSTLLMPLGLYTPFVDGIGSLHIDILFPAGIGAVITVICLARLAGNPCL